MSAELKAVIVKRIHTVDGVTFVRLDESIVRKLGLDSDEVWAEQRIVDDGIMLVIRRRHEQNV